MALHRITPLAATLFAAVAFPGCAPLEPQQAVPAPAARSTIGFDIHANERLALFLFSYHAARGLSDREFRSPLPLSEDDAALLARFEREFAPVATAFAPYLDSHPGFNRAMQFMAGNLTGAEVEFPDPELKDALDRFVPVYRAHFAPRHARITGSMKADLEAQLALHGDAMGRAVARELGGEWREEPVRLDLVPYATRIGAYTNFYQTVMSAAMAEYRDHALEMAFHEAAHTDPMDDSLKAVAQAALDRHGIENDRFWHYLQFYGVGRAAQSVLGPDYVPYHEATGLSQRSGAEFYAAIDEVWDDHSTIAARADAALALVKTRSD